MAKVKGKFEVIYEESDITILTPIFNDEFGEGKFKIDSDKKVVKTWKSAPVDKSGWTHYVSERNFTYELVAADVVLLKEI